MLQSFNQLHIQETTPDDLPNILELWADGEVMQYVGFPNGLKVSMTVMENWYNKMKAKACCKHYSIYDASLGFCGEVFYDIDTDNKLSALDIKLFSHARGKGIAEAALTLVLNEVFETGLCSRAYVEPDKNNLKAWILYEKLGFTKALRPDFLESNETYLEITKQTWQMQSGQLVINMKKGC